LDHAPRRVNGISGWFSKHSDRVWCVQEENSLWRDEIFVSKLDQSCLLAVSEPATEDNCFEVI
jgi:hypothetical protein